MPWFTCPRVIDSYGRRLSFTRAQHLGPRLCRHIRSEDSAREQLFQLDTGRIDTKVQTRSTTPWFLGSRKLVALSCTPTSPWRRKPFQFITSNDGRLKSFPPLQKQSGIGLSSFGPLLAFTYFYCTIGFPFHVICE